MPRVAIVIGSPSDESYLEDARALLTEFGVEYEFRAVSAHRNPDATREFATTARDRGVEVIIAAAGMAAHLPGVVASLTTLPVIGVPLPGSELRGLDSLYAIVQMPAGVPVACMAVGSHGARNAALFAVQILSLQDERLRDAFAEYKANLARPRS
ncbi:MAG: 5-(carboxyamino)imidazole ribonucleotide mutase [Chloroflexota bacterium]|nr:5-(carboxyamino)imidazole ribonucleotide mutase [Chloroflexota bacterium]